jgi:hypothetical protein
MLALESLHQFGKAEAVVGDGPMWTSVAVMSGDKPPNQIGNIGGEAGKALGFVAPVL